MSRIPIAKFEYEKFMRHFSGHCMPLLTGDDQLESPDWEGVALASDAIIMSAAADL